MTTLVRTVCLGCRFSRAAVALLLVLGSTGLLPSAAHALELAYSFETGTDGFGPNPTGGGITVTQDTIGATEGASSLKVAISNGQTFVGALASELAPSVGDPPGLDYFLVDITIPEAFTGTFADLGVTFFGDSQPNYPGGQVAGAQVQFIRDQVSLGALGPGTHRNVLLDLTRGNFHPLTFQFPVSFDDAFGTLGSGPNDLIPTGFQFYVNLAGGPITLYFDNVRTGQIYEADYNGDGVVDAADYTVWRDSIDLETPIVNPASFFEGDGNQDGVVNNNDYAYWADRYGLASAGVAQAGIATPEPTAAILLVVGGLGLLTRPRYR